MTTAFRLHQSIQAFEMLCCPRNDLVAQGSDRIYIGSDIGEEATNERGLAETVDDTQGIKVGETGRSAS